MSSGKRESKKILVRCGKKGLFGARVGETPTLDLFKNVKTNGQREERSSGR